ncbi:hypothetical protein [Methylophilus sp. YYY-1]|uniref:hypothetical protein n=1 Tax=Methylophilus sp. YYY-1 TaxID=2682087 RepID=UPI0023B23BD0|nr:hypothetical protein [Methylophilus sp. YYY-1]MDF0377677.1 hypothetical protein [Methylophilus sp. YYY-1]
MIYAVLGVSAFVGGWLGWAIGCKKRNLSNTVAHGGGFIVACLMTAIVLNLIAAPSKDVVAETEKTETFITPQNLKEVSVDVIYGWQDTFMKEGKDSAFNEVVKLQKVLRSWPESQQTFEEPCFMQLKNETARILNMIDGLSPRGSPENADYRLECRKSINYVYDAKRVSNVWQNL